MQANFLVNVEISDSLTAHGKRSIIKHIKWCIEKNITNTSIKNVKVLEVEDK